MAKLQNKMTLTNETTGNETTGNETTGNEMTGNEIVPTEFVPTDDNMYEPDEADFDYNEYAAILEAIGAGENDWITVYQLSGDGTKAEIIIGVSGQIDRFFKVSCLMTSNTFRFLCIDFITSTVVTRDSIERINEYRVRLGLVPWTLESAYRDYFGGLIHLAPPF